jgi:hypothetical protein
VNWQLYITWATEILGIASQIVALQYQNGDIVKPADALKTAHDLVSAHVENLKVARTSEDSDSSVKN